MKRSRRSDEDAKHYTYLIEQGCTGLRVEVFVPNHGAHRLYQKLSYRDMDIDLTKVVGS
jgi:hypothetical protein